MSLNPHVLSPDNVDWLASQAMNELHGYLSDGDPYADNGQEWPEMARGVAAQCRQIAAAAMNPETEQSWIDLARQYEETIREEDRLCKRCGSPLTGINDPAVPQNSRPAGYCSDQTCPYSGHLQNETWSEG